MFYNIMVSKKKLLCFFVLQAMLAAQVLIAQHATVHFFEDSYIGYHEHTDQGHHDKDKQCELCLFVKGFNDALISVPPFISVILLQHNFIPSLAQAVKHKTLSLAYLSRAPPVFLF
tara:strand:- start:499 stop:846 length:348 start_codon:yes stop_codon:yes gene_type:complete